MSQTTEQTEQKKTYKASLNLPQTGFPMEAKLTANEPARLKKWQDMRLYETLMEQRKDAQKWILHDGPPFANGDIHIGHLINKTLKDVILRFRSMQGFQTPYVPGWDCHGLPIEHKIQQDLGPKLREMSVLDVRKRCFEYADKYVGLQSQQFQRLGILGEWNNPYVTMRPEYEAQSLEVFARFVEAGLVYKQLKPVPWSIENQTALADAELEYQDRDDESVYVLFEVEDASKLPASLSCHTADPVYLLIWTTTPWTLPANLAVAVNPQSEYGLYAWELEGRTVRAVVARECSKELVSITKDFPAFVNGYCSGSDLEGLTYRHPFTARTGKVVLADYVTLDTGTGLVHTAPGHGEDDYETGLREKLAIYSPVLANGRFDDTVPEWIRGKKVWEANPIIINHLKDKGLLFASLRISHSYPHDWRSKTPIIFRATEQWFVAMDKLFRMSPDEKYSGDLRTRALRAVLGMPVQIDQMTPEQERYHYQIAKASEEGRPDAVKFVPTWGRARLVGMLESRPDWCISRQRAWGLPIPVFYNEKGEALLTPQSVRAVARRFAKIGSNAWFTDSPADLLGPDFRYPPGFAPANLRKEKDIFDVWWESGSSWHAVLNQRPNLKFPADLYLEGSDQHRGWFQLSLLTSLGATGEAPYKNVLTHGFSVKPDGTKVSKSDKEYVTATQEVDRHGADLLRLWCCSVDYQNDIPTSPAAIKEFGDKYRKIRNTLRYLLSNLYDYAPAETVVPDSSLDGMVLYQLDLLIQAVHDAYHGYSLHRVFRLLHDFCAVEISAVYGNAMKDRLYCEQANSHLRRRCQFVLCRMVDALTRMLAPMLVFTADEAWEFIPRAAGEGRLPSVHLALLPKPRTRPPAPEARHEWQVLTHLRQLATGQLDGLKKTVGLNKALDAEVIYSIADESLRTRLEAYGPDLEDIVGAGYHSFALSTGGEPSVNIVDRRQDYKACARSWKRRPDVGSDGEFPDLSKRDAAAVRAAKG